MGVMSYVSAGAERMRYGAKWLLLSIYGAGEQDRDVDPIENLDSEHDLDPEDHEDPHSP
jgi:hypothetical protein